MSYLSVAEDVKQIIKDQVGLGSLPAEEQTLESLDVDSLDRTELLVILGHRFGIHHISEREAEKWHSVSDVVITAYHGERGLIV